MAGSFAVDGGARAGIRRGDLRRRFAIALIGLTVATAAIQGLGYWSAERWVDRSGLQDLLGRVLAHRISTGEALDDGPVDDDPALHYFRPGADGNAPAALAALTPGWHDRVVLDGRDYRALVRDAAPGDRAYLLYDISVPETRQMQLLTLFSGGTIVIAAMAFWVSTRLARRALAPLDELVAEIRALNPETRGARLRTGGGHDLGVIVEALNGYMRELDTLIDRERAFAAAASHELRTPLAVIAGASELLAAAPSEPARPLARVDRAVRQARMDLDALLALSRRHQSQSLEALSLADLLPEWAEPHALTHAETRLIWHLAPVEVRALPGSLHILFTNLLRNALRAAGPGGTVTVDLAAGRLRIVDDGPGMPADELPHVFEPNFRGRDGGTGIGLYIAATLAARYGWQLALRNRDDSRGACAELCWS